MTLSPISRRLVWYLVLSPLILMGAKENGCKKVVDPPGEPIAAEDDTEGVQTVADKLQVVSLSPGYHVADDSFSARLDGAGFQAGLKVLIGTSPSNAIEATGLSLSGTNSIRLTVPALIAGSYDVVVQNPDGKRSVLRRGLIIKSATGQYGECAFVRIQFDLDKAGLTAAGKGIVADRGQCLAEKSTVVVEGHADERGTTSYNLGLGQRRASTVSRALIAQGVPANSLEVVSLGEERPADAGHNEDAWTKNRRVDIHAK